MNKNDCIFCKIVLGDIPSYKVYEDNEFLGFLDIRPLNPGNSLLISIKHYRWVYDVPNFGDYWNAAKKIALATQKVVGSHSINFLTLGYEVPHAHIRIIPRFDNDGHTDGIRLSAVKEIAKEEMEEVAEKIRKAID
ncbi:HIT domain-containing protein [Candidatus Roizmanbacteria bacterium]|nr:HIT domain-containing protein [Candidatus Roizmanbacteria bacterium]